MKDMNLAKKSLNNLLGRKNAIRNFAVGLISILVVFGLINYIRSWQNNSVIYSAQNWSHFPGAEIVGETVQIKSVGRAITHTDTSTPQPNPPVNVRGPHLKISGDFQIKVSQNGISNGTTFQMFGQVPNIYDEWRQERQSMSIEADSNQIKVRIWDGTSPSSIDERTFNVALGDNETFVISHKGDKIVIGLNNITLGGLPDHKIFSNGTIWFGADSRIDSEGWTINSIETRGLGKGQVKVAAPPNLIESTKQPDTLQKLASTNPRNLLIGAAVALYPLQTDLKYRSIALSQFGIITPENSFKPQFIHPQKDLYTFQEADGLVETAQANKILVHGHALILSKAIPEWMQATPEAELKQVMIDHITKVAGHFKGKIASWDVVNEPLSGDDLDYSNGNLGIQQQMWFDAMGENYIDIAFKTARLVDPAAKLYLNDFGMENDGQRFDAMVALVQRLKARGVPVDGVGFETHIYHSPVDLINPEELRNHIKILASLGILSRISEIDVLGDKEDVQAQQYSQILKVCLEEPSCTSYTTWGITDLYGSTTTSDRYPAKLGDSLLWDSNFEPKKAFKSLQELLREK